MKLGWRWCPGATGYCFLCQKLIKGVWRHYVSTTTSNRDVCGCCAGEGEA